MSQFDDIKDDLEILEIDPSQELTIRYVTSKYKRLAKYYIQIEKGEINVSFKSY